MLDLSHWLTVITQYLAVMEILIEFLVEVNWEDSTFFLSFVFLALTLFLPSFTPLLLLSSSAPSLLLCLFCPPYLLLHPTLSRSLSVCLSGSSLPSGVYGDVQRVKILYNKKDSALIQLSDGNQAQLGKF